MKSRLSPQQKKKYSYAKDRRNAYGERGANSRHAIRENKLHVERSRRHAENLVLHGAFGIPDEELLTIIENRVRSRPSSKKRFHKMPDAPLAQVVEYKLARREMLRTVEDTVPLIQSSLPCDGTYPEPRSPKPRRISWRLHPSEVVMSMSANGDSGRRNYSMEMTLEHLPTNVAVIGQSAKGNYTRALATAARRELYVKLFVELERQVAKFLRLPGRASDAS